MLKINLMTGTAWTKSIITEGTTNSDLLGCIDEFVSKYGIDNLPVVAYEFSELDEYEQENYIPINGGEWYIEGIASIEEIEEIEGIKESCQVCYNTSRYEISVFNKINNEMIFSLDDENNTFDFYRLHKNESQVLIDNMDIILESIF